MPEASEQERLSARWQAINDQLADIAAARAPTAESDEVGDYERGLLEELDRIEGRLGEIQPRRI